MTQALTRGPYQSGIRRKEQILQVAWSVFARRGYSTATLREISDAVGVTPAAVLRHFGSKEALLTAVLDKWTVESAALVVRLELGDGLAYFLGFPALMRYHVEHQGLIELFLTMSVEASSSEHPAREWVARRYERVVLEAIEHLELAMTEGRVRTMERTEVDWEVRALYAAMDGLEIQWLSNPKLDLPGLFEAMFARTLQRWGAPEESWRPLLTEQ